MTEPMNTNARNVELLKSFKKILEISPIKPMLPGQICKITSNTPLGLVIDHAHHMHQGIWGFARFIEALKGDTYGDLIANSEDLVNYACNLFKISKFEAFMIIYRIAKVKEVLEVLLDPEKIFGPRFPIAAQFWKSLEDPAIFRKQLLYFQNNKCKNGLADLLKLKYCAGVPRESADRAYTLLRETFKELFTPSTDRYYGTGRTDIMTGGHEISVGVQDKINFEHKTLHILSGPVPWITSRQTGRMLDPSE